MKKVELLPNKETLGLPRVSLLKVDCPKLFLTKTQAQFRF
jgi:hypothetical protein